MKDNVFNMPKPVTVMGRSSSITNSYVNGVIPVIQPTDEEIEDALKTLGQNENDVCCVYCGDPKTEWDHLYPLIRNKEATGYISEIKNLVPACGKCNQSKGNRDWEEWMRSDAKQSPSTRGIPDLEERIRIIRNYDETYKKTIINLEELAGHDLWISYETAKNAIIKDMKAAQKIADKVKKKIEDTLAKQEII